MIIFFLEETLSPHPLFLFDVSIIDTKLITKQNRINNKRKAENENELKQRKLGTQRLCMEKSSSELLRSST